MTHDARHAEDGELLESLASVVQKIRELRYSELANDVQTAVRNRADGFINRLADHLRHEEGHLFPRLVAARPNCQESIDGLLREHGCMRDMARDLSVAVVDEKSERALEVSREFLALLLSHMEREDRLVDRVLRALPPKEAAELNRIIQEASQAAEDRGIIRA